MVMADPGLLRGAASSAMQLGPPVCTVGPSAAGTAEMLAAVLGGLARGELVAYSVEDTPTISAAELEMLERRRRSRSIPAPPLPPRPPPVEESLHRYSIRVIDDTNSPIPGVCLKLEIDGTPRMPTTDANGVATAEWYSRAPASVRILDQTAIEARLRQRRVVPRSDALPTGPDVHDLTVGRSFADVKVPADQETTLVLCRTPSHDWIEIELECEQGGTYPGEVEIQLASGETRRVRPGADGVLRLDGIPPGTCRVELLGVDPACCKQV